MLSTKGGFFRGKIRIYGVTGTYVVCPINAQEISREDNLRIA